MTIHSVPVPGPCHFLLFLLTHLPHHNSGQVLSPLPPKYFLNLLSPPYEQRLCQALIISQQTNETVSLLMMCLKPDFLYPNLFFTQPTVVDPNVNMTRLPPRLIPFPVSFLTCREKNHTTEHVMLIGGLPWSSYNLPLQSLTLALTGSVPETQSSFLPLSSSSFLCLTCYFKVHLSCHLLLQSSCFTRWHGYLTLLCAYVLPCVQFYNYTHQTCCSYSFNVYLLNTYSTLGK